MADPNERDAKLIQYLQNAHGNEKKRETALGSQIEATTKAPYKKRLKQHLKETKAHAKALEKRIRTLGGAQRPARPSGEQEKMLANARTQYAGQHEKISSYLSLESFAQKVGDSETAKLARGIRREEERMARYLEGQIKQLSNAVATAEVPAALRRVAGKAKRRTTKRATAKAAAKKAAAKKSTAKKATTKKSTARKSTAKKSSAKKSTARKSSKAKAKKSAAKSK